MIRSQIQEREQQHLLNLEKKDQETQAMLHYLERLQEEDMGQLQRKRETQNNLMEEVAKCNEVSLNWTHCTCDLHWLWFSSLVCEG